MAENECVETNAVIDGNMLRCGECNARLFDIVEVYRNDIANCKVRIKCKGKRNGKTCNSFNVVLL